MPWDNRGSRVPRSAARQNLLYNIESLARLMTRAEANTTANPSEQTVQFFKQANTELEHLRRMVENDFKLRQVYIYQKLFDISRDLLRYAAPLDLEYQCLYVQRTMSEGFEPNETDKQYLEVLKKEMARRQKDDDANLSVEALAALLHLYKVIQDRQAATILQSEQLATTSAKLGVLLFTSALLFMSVYAVLAGHFPPFEGPMFTSSLRIVGAFLGGLTGGCLSAIATSRQGPLGRGDSSDGKDYADRKSLPLTNTDLIRPLLGGVAGLLFGMLAAMSDAKPEFTLFGSVAFGFSEQLLYDMLRRRGNQLSDQLGNQVLQGTTKRSRGR